MEPLLWSGFIEKNNSQHITGFRECFGKLEHVDEGGRGSSLTHVMEHIAGYAQFEKNSGDFQHYANEIGNVLI